MRQLTILNRDCWSTERAQIKQDHLKARTAKVLVAVLGQSTDIIEASSPEYPVIVPSLVVQRVIRTMGQGTMQVGTPDTHAGRNPPTVYSLPVLKMTKQGTKTRLVAVEHYLCMRLLVLYLNRLIHVVIILGGITK